MIEFTVFLLIKFYRFFADNSCDQYYLFVVEMYYLVPRKKRQTL